MGKGVSRCQQRGLELGDPQAIELTVLPRKERTTWETRDGRVRFWREEGGWKVCASLTAPDLADLKVLQQAGIINSSYGSIMSFDSLKAAQSFVNKAFSFCDNPPLATLHQKDLSYQIKATPFLVHKLPGFGWKLAYERLDTPSIANKCLALHQDPDADYAYEEYERLDELIRHLISRPFKTRARAVRALKDWYTSNYQDLKRLRFLEGGFDG